MTLKTFTPSRVQVKNAEAGQVEAVFATLKAIDKDGDVILPGAIDDGAQVVISAFSHESWKGKLPVGRGTIHEVGDELVVKAQFFMDTTHGVDTFNTVKGLAGDGEGSDNLGEWSFSLQEVTATKGRFANSMANIISRIASIKEVSPTLIGAGVNTRTLAVKSAETKQLNSSLRRLLSQAGRERWDDYPHLIDFDTDEGFAVFELYEGPGVYRLIQVDFTRTDTSVELGETETEVHESATYLPKTGVKFSEHLSSVVADVKALTARAEEVMALRAAKGKTISDEAIKGIGATTDALKRLEALIGQPAEEANPQGDADGIDIEAEFLRADLLIQGVQL